MWEIETIDHRPIAKYAWPAQGTNISSKSFRIQNFGSLKV